MSDRNGTINGYRSLVKNLGRAAVSSFYPNDIEYYLCAFELVTSQGTEGYFVFPIQPSSIQKNENTRTSVKQSLSGITVLRNSSFTPQELTIKGNFGRRFKILSNLDGVAFQPSSASKRKGITFQTPEFSGSIKTGYGATKLLQKILSDANEVDNLGKPKKLYFYNLGLGESYLVVIPPQGITFSQAEDTNMIWQYQISMIILAPLGDVTNVDVKSSNSNIMSKGAVQNFLNTVAKEVKLMIS